MTFNNVQAQVETADFGPPLDIPLFLSGNFAELRSNHFHTGIDIKTEGVEGQNILSAQDGFVSRIGVSPYGYGNALYIQHPNGYTTVYGHLRSYNKVITQAIRKEQYTQESFAVDFFPEDTIFVKKGDIVALSGNSGGSRGAHLHFEIRDTKTERPQNPLKFGFDVKDDIPPKIRGIRVHPLSKETFINGEHKAKSFVVSGADGKYRLKQGSKIEIFGAFGLSIHALDYLNGQHNKCGIYSLDLKVDDKEICHQTFDELDFSTSRNINSYKDYEVFRQNNWHYHKSFVEPGNNLEIYRVDSLMGRMNFSEDKTHHAKYEVADTYGNTSVVDFSFITKSVPPRLPNLEPFDAYFAWNQPNEFEYEGEIGIQIPKGALYQDLEFQFGREMKKPSTLSPIYSIQATYVPLQKPIEILFDWGTISENQKNKVMAVRESVRGGKSYLSGKNTAEGFKIKSKSFGKFYLSMDTIAPTLYASKWSASGHLNSRSKLQFKIKDDKSGIASYRGTLNGNWVLLQYDPKNKRLWMDVGESKFQKGSNIVEVEIEDKCGNTVKKTFNYTY